MSQRVSEYAVKPVSPRLKSQVMCSLSS